ncbi:MAG: hypothetical protein WD830_09990 [Chloroflexota bacterium]
MELNQFLTALVGAFFGAAGWLLVGLYMQRRANERLARNAARAVYFELAMNEIDIDVASKHGVFGPLRRGSFDRLLPELATWLGVDELEVIVRAYMSHAGYEQTQRDEKLPMPVRAALLGHVLAEHRAASGLLRRKSFSTREAAGLSTMSSEAAGADASAASSQARSG